MEWVVIRDQPFVEPETPAFNRYIKSLRNSAETYSNCTIRNDIIDRFAEEHGKIKAKMEVILPDFNMY